MTTTHEPIDRLDDIILLHGNSDDAIVLSELREQANYYKAYQAAVVDRLNKIKEGAKCSG